MCTKYFFITQLLLPVTPDGTENHPDKRATAWRNEWEWISWEEQTPARPPARPPTSTSYQPHVAWLEAADPLSGRALCFCTRAVLLDVMDVRWSHRAQERSEQVLSAVYLLCRRNGKAKKGTFKLGFMFCWRLRLNMCTRWHLVVVGSSEPTFVCSLRAHGRARWKPQTETPHLLVVNT